MSLEKKSTHVRLAPDMHERAKVLAKIAGKDVAEYLAFILEKALVGEWHVLSVQAKTLERLGVGALMRDLSTEVWEAEGAGGIGHESSTT